MSEKKVRARKGQRCRDEGVEKGEWAKGCEGWDSEEWKRLKR